MKSRLPRSRVRYFYHLCTKGIVITTQPRRIGFQDSFTYSFELTSESLAVGVGRRRKEGAMNMTSYSFPSTTQTLSREPTLVFPKLATRK